MSPPVCEHPEGYIEYSDDDGLTKRRSTPGHDCEYVEARNALIPAAERLAAERVKPFLRPEDRIQPNASGHWTRYFLAAVNELMGRREVEP